MSIRTLVPMNSDVTNPGAMTPQQMQILQQQIGVQGTPSSAADAAAGGLPSIPPVTPGADSYNSALLAHALRGDGAVEHPLEGIGRMAQLASGYAGIMRGDEAAGARQSAVANNLSRNGGGAGAGAASPAGSPDALLYTLAMSGDPTLVHAAVGQKLSKREAAEKEAHQQALREQAASEWSAATTPEDQARVAMKWGYGENVMRQAFGKSERASALSEKTAQYKALGYDDKQAGALALGLNPNNLPGRAMPEDEFVNSSDTVDPSDKVAYAAAVAADRKRHGENTKEIVGNARQAQRNMMTLEQARTAMGGANTGAFADKITFAKKIGNAIGVTDYNVSNEELLTSTQNALGKVARDGYPGSVSNFEMQTYLKSVPSLLNSPAGNEAILFFMQHAAKAHIDRAELMKEWGDLRRKAGKSTLLADGFDNFEMSRTAEREEQFRRDLGDKLKAAGVSIGREGQQPQSRVQKYDATNGEGRTATGPNGEKVVFRNGAWVPVTPPTSDDLPPAGWGG